MLNTDRVVRQPSFKLVLGLFSDDFDRNEAHNFNVSLYKIRIRYKAKGHKIFSVYNDLNVIKIHPLYFITDFANSLEHSFHGCNYYCS